jgi:hypothetical protein
MRIDFSPIVKLAVLAIAGIFVLVLMTLARAFFDISVWWAWPAIVVTYLALRLTAFRDL